MDGIATTVEVTDSVVLTPGKIITDEVVGKVALSLCELICIVVGTKLEKGGDSVVETAELEVEVTAILLLGEPSCVVGTGNGVVPSTIIVV